MGDSFLKHDVIAQNGIEVKGGKQRVDATVHTAV